MKTPDWRREIRALGVYSEIHPHDITLQQLQALPNVKGVILNGGANRVVDGVVHRRRPGDLRLRPAGASGRPQGRRPPGPPTRRPASRLSLISSSAFAVPRPTGIWRTSSPTRWSCIRQQVGDKKVLLALSGGVDSSVVAALLIKAVGKQLTCVHVNHGLLRKGEPEQVIQVFRNEMDANLIYVDAVDRFLDKLAGVADPEQKRKIIGAEFIRVFEEEARKLDGIDFLGQGTIYPDIIESGTKTVKAVKAHHNVGGLPEDLDFAAGGAAEDAV